MSGDMSSPFSFSNSIASVSGDLAPQDAAWFRKIMSDCILCPRACHADRLDDGVGYCGQTADIMAARASLHYWEEPCISGTSGSGTVFFSNFDIVFLFMGIPIIIPSSFTCFCINLINRILFFKLFYIILYIIAIWTLFSIEIYIKMSFLFKLVFYRSRICYSFFFYFWK